MCKLQTFLYYRVFLQILISLFIRFQKKGIIFKSQLRKMTISELKHFFKEQLSQLSLQGLILYYKNIPTLENVAWLNPQATVEHIHTEVFEKGKMKEFKGIVSKTAFEEICPDEKIVASYTKTVRTLYDEIALKAKESQSLVDIRDTLLPKLLSGEVDVSDLHGEGIDG